jgi:hypothetical protein
LLVTSCGQPKQRVMEQETIPRQAPTLNYHALVIGVSDYTGTGWPQLGTASADAKAIGDILRSRYGFNVMELTDRKATRGNILRTLDQLMNLTDDDALLIYFAGHGFYDDQMDEGYWIPYGAQRSRMELPAKEDWIWNSSISRVLSATPAKHVLLVADTCYGGSLFRGEDVSDKSNQWYQRAMKVPSRYLITSGNLEPVLDSGIRHSVFAQEILTFLEYTELDIFSASDIAVSIRTKVSQFTGQLVRMGPLASPAHAGGEFVFIRSGKALSTLPADTEESPEPIYRSSTPEERVLNLAAQIETYSRNSPESNFIRPRILACLGPTGSDPEETTLIRNRLNKYLKSIGGSILVEREAFDTLLHEMELGRSGLADQRAATEIGKLLPASLILFGEIIHAGEEKEIHVRIVDTETSRVLSAASASFSSHHELDSVCQSLAEQIMHTMNQARPLTFPALQTDTGTLRAGWGKFHGARIGDLFEIITQESVGTIAQKETLIGTAQLLSLGEEEAEYQALWNQSAVNQPTNLLLRVTL